MANRGGWRRQRRRACWTAIALICAIPLIEATSRPARAAVPEPQFAPYQLFYGTGGRSIAVADFTGDGLKDVVSHGETEVSPSATVKVFLYTQAPDGTFHTSAGLDEVPSEPRQPLTTLTAGDIDGDQRADVAVATDTGINVFLQRSGGLAPALNTPFPGTRRVKLADLDTDGRLDLLVSGTSGVAWLRGNGDGTFGAPVPISPVAHMIVEVGHFSRDNRPDIVGSHDGTLYVFLQRPDGTFEGREMDGVGDGDLALGDLTGDGLDDVAVTVSGNSPGAAVVVWPQRQDGSLAPAVRYPAYDIPRPLVLADVNGDGRKDVVTAHSGWSAVGVMVQDSDGRLTKERLYSTPYRDYGEEQLAVDDITGDGRPDIIAGGGDGFLVLRGLPPLPPPSTSSTTSTTSGPTTTTLPKPAAVDEATAWQIDPGHSGASSGGPQRLPLAQRWSRDLGGTVSYPLIAGGRVFAMARTPYGSPGSTLYALDAATGRDLWGPIDLGTRALFAYGDGQVFVVNTDHALRSFDAATGRLRWIVMASSNSPPVYKDGVVYLNGAYGNRGRTLVAVSAADGRLLWQQTYKYNEVVPDTAPAVADGIVFVGGVCSPNSGWKATTGELLWSTLPATERPLCYGGWGARTPVVGAGLVWERHEDYDLPQARELASGSPVTSFSTDAAPAFDATQGYFLSRGGIEARTPRTQEVLWRFTGDGQLTAAPIVANGYVYAASATGQVWALDAKTGAVAWSDNAGAPVLRPQEDDRPAFNAMAAGQGIVAVPATNRLVAYASAAGASVPSATTPKASNSARPAFAPSASEESSGFRADAAHQSSVITNTIDGPPLRKRWTRDLGSAAEYSIVADGTMFATAGGKLFALDLLTGEDRWGPVVLDPNGGRANVSYGDGRVFAAATAPDMPLRAFDADTGRELWSTAMDGYAGQSFPVPAVYDGGRVFAHTYLGPVLAVSAATGEHLWTEFSNGSPLGPPTVSGNLVIVSSCETGAHALDAATGTVIWDALGRCLGGSSPLSAVSAGELWTESPNVTPLVHDAASGRLIGASSGMLPAFDESSVYAMEGSALKRRDRATMSTQWTFLGDGALATPPVVVNGRIYIASSTGRLWVLDASTGTLLWSDDVGLPIATRGPFWYLMGANIVAGQGVVGVPAGNAIVVYESVPGPGGGYHGLTPARLLDTRSGLGAPAAKVGPGGSVDLQVTGRGGVPATGVSAVALNVTVTAPTAESFLTTWPTEHRRPLASNLNYLAKQTVPNMVVVKVGQGGKVSLFNNDGSTDLVVDVAGWYGVDDDPQGARYSPLAPSRLLDTRATDAPVARLGPASTGSLKVTGVGGVPQSGVTAVALNVTVTGPTAESFLTVWPAGEGRPMASNLNYQRDQTVPNMVIVKVGASGMVNLFNNVGSADVIVDVAGWYGPEDATAGPRYRALAPTRILDSRIGLGAPTGKMMPESTLTMQVTGRGGVPVAGVSAVVLNVTVTGPTAVSFLTAWPSGEARPLASNLNYRAGQTVPNLVIVKVGLGGKVDLFNYLGATDLVVDVAGWYGP